MNAQVRRTRLLGGLILLVASLVSWFVVLAPRFSEPAILQQTASQTLDRKALLDQQILALERRQRYLPIAQKQVALLDGRFPSTAMTSNLFSEILRNAVSVGLPKSQTLIAIGDATVSVPSPAPAANTGSDSTTTGDTSTSAGAGATPAPAASAAPAAPAASSAGSSAEMPITITVVGTPDQATQFLSRLATLRRALTIDGVDIALQPAQNGVSSGLYAIVISARSFLLPKIQPVPPNLERPAAPPVPGPANSGTKKQ